MPLFDTRNSLRREVALPVLIQRPICLGCTRAAKANQPRACLCGRNGSTPRKTLPQGLTLPNTGCTPSGLDQNIN